MDPDGHSNEKELQIDYRIKIRMNEIMDDLNTDEHLDVQQDVYNSKHRQIDFSKLKGTLNDSEKKFLEEEEKILRKKFKSKLQGLN